MQYSQTARLPHPPTPPPVLLQILSISDELHYMPSVQGIVPKANVDKINENKAENRKKKKRRNVPVKENPINVFLIKIFHMIILSRI